LAARTQWVLACLDMKTKYYLYHSGKLKRQDHSLVYTYQEKKVFLPIGQIDIIYIFAQIDINQNVIKLLNKHKVMIFFFTFNGQFIGKYLPHQLQSGKHIIAHALFVHDEERRQALAKSIILGSIKNMIFIIKYYQKKKRIKEYVIQNIQSVMKKVSDTHDFRKLLMLEAETKKIYYATFDSIILNTDFHFQSRSFYPPQNEVNALMSFGYAMLYSRLESSIHRSRLSIELPFVHGHSKQNSGLHHDIADIFKPIFVDRLIFQMINKKMVWLEHFENRSNGVYLNKAGMTMFIAQFEDYMKKTIKLGKKHYSYRQLLSKEVHKISRFVHDEQVYKPFVLTRW
jgi:CRISP-associated protein Cas1